MVEGTEVETSSVKGSDLGTHPYQISVMEVESDVFGDYVLHSLGSL